VCSQAQTSTIPLVLEKAPAAAQASARGEHDRSSRVMVLCYHRFAKKKADSLSTTDAELRRQLLAVRAAGFEFIKMDDFLAWREGKANIPALSAVVTIDDGFKSTLELAHPIFKELKVPYVLYPYINYVGGGSQALTWEQVRQLYKQGVEIGSHSVAHDHMSGLKTPKAAQVGAAPGEKAWGSDVKSPQALLARLSAVSTGDLSGAVALAGAARWSQVGMARDPYEEWLWNELYGSRARIAEELGYWPRTFAYPFGSWSERVARMGLEAGYEALFTVNPDEVNFSTPVGGMDRFVIYSDHPELFDKALRFRVVGATPEGDPAELPAGVTVAPARHALSATRQPLIQANIRPWLEAGADPAKLALRLSGFGPAPFTLDPATGALSAQAPALLRGASHTAALTGVNGKGEKLALRWSFLLPPPAPAPSSSSSTPLTPSP
jgi:peptidoglycan/xylan/chitin deacetylase (PgdA/CDA1 family)